MAEVCPTVTATSPKEYKGQIEQIVHFTRRVHIDLTDGKFAPANLVDPKEAWWPVGMKADFHMMHKDPEDAVRTVIKHKPHLIIVHAEAEGSFEAFAEFCKHHKVKVGVALLQKTEPEVILPALPLIDHVLLFSGNLGHQGGAHTDLEILNKLSILVQTKPELEIGWDGGVNDQNIPSIVFAGVDVVNVGSYIQKAENPRKAFEVLQRIADETGET
jgi:ribulose-phosphate 3-epimerase